MTTDRSTEYLAGLMRELCKLPRETEWTIFGTLLLTLQNTRFADCWDC